MSLEQTELAPGEVLGRRLPSGTYVLLWVVTLREYLGTVPVCALLDWRGVTLLDADEMQLLKLFGSP